jgi:pyruvate-ferredoxin/flavodoxin oxidoreductase
MAAPTLTSTFECVDGNDAVARVAYALSDVAAIYPITPSSPMGEAADTWMAAGRRNIWDGLPQVVEMQSEAGAAGALHGAVQKGALGVSFTASQGLLLKIPNMYKIAGELTPAVIHVAARTVATHALSIFGDHSDVMAVRQTGWALLASSTVQQAQDLALVAHAATLEARVPFLHFFDGFRTSHELNTVEVLSDDDLVAMIDDEALHAHRARGLSPERPVLRGSAQNPDVFFQAREATNPYYDRLPGLVGRMLDRFADRTGRRYGLVDYHGAPDAERVVVLMGSGVGAAREAAATLTARGEKVGVVEVHLYRPFPAEAFVEALPATVRRVAVLDRTKEPGAPGDPLYLDVVATAAERLGPAAPRIVGGRYGLSSKEFTPRMVAAVFAELGREAPRNHFTVGIVDDVTHRSLAVDETFPQDPAKVRAVFFGLGSDGTVGANKNSVKIVGQGTGMHAQGYFEYDSRKAGAVTISHLRFDDEPIDAPYLIEEADFVACHQFGFLERMDVLKKAKPGATFLLNSPYAPEETWEHLPEEVQSEILLKGLDVHLVDAFAVARDAQLGGRINTVMQTCFFALSRLLPTDEALARIKESVRDTYGKRGRTVVERNIAAVDAALAALHRMPTPAPELSGRHRRPAVPADAPDFVQRVTSRIIAGEGNLLPVSAFPVDGTFPTGTSRFEKRSLAHEIPIWDPDICIDCAKCAIVCPHAAIRMKVFDPAALDGAPSGFQAKDYKAKDLAGNMLTIQVAPDDCTGCGICVDVCPARSKEVSGHKSINMRPVGEHVDRERTNFDFFLDIPEFDRDRLRKDTVKGSQALQPLFEFSSACAGCGETPYLKLLTQLFGDRIVVANATGCSSIYGGNLPVTPWARNAQGRGPAWSNSLFEDNAEFGFGMRVAHDAQGAAARRLLTSLAPQVGGDLAAEILDASQSDDQEISAQRDRVARLTARLKELDDPRARHLGALAGELVDQSVWIVGGDGWAYDIGFGGLDHVLASGRDVNVLILDTEVYSNTGGQASKATPRGATAKFATAGKASPKKDIGMIAMAYGNVYVAQVAIGANDMHTVRAMNEAQAWPGPSLVIAYSTCIAHGIDMSTSMTHQKEAVTSGYWPLFRYHPGETAEDTPLRLDSRPPSTPVRDFAMKEGRFAMLARTAPEESKRLLAMAQADIDERWRLYEQMAEIKRRVPSTSPEQGRGPGTEEET